MLGKSKKEIAEQKLLKMIEATSGVKPKVDPKVLKQQAALSIHKNLNRLLVVLVVGVLLYFVYSIIQGVDVLGKEINIPVDRKGSHKGPGVEMTVPESKELKYYLDAMINRNIFQPLEAEKTKAVVSTDKNSRLAQQVKPLKLVGVSWLDSVESASVMIEDTDKKETYFLQKGAKVGESDITVKTIYADSAILGYENEEITIKYDKPQM